jgi:hypothetical protein
VTAGARWASAGLVELTLPSGFRVRGVLPAPSEVIRRKIVPGQLRAAVFAMSGKKLSELTEDEEAVLVDARRHQAAAFLREIYDEQRKKWEPLTVTVDDLASGAYPPADIEALDDLVMGLRTPEQITAASEIALGLRPATDGDEEAASTVNGWAEFRDEPRSGDADPERSDLAPTPITAARPNRAARRAPAGRRARVAASPREAAG